MLEECKITIPEEKLDDKVFDTDILEQYDSICSEAFPFFYSSGIFDLRNITFMNPYGALGILILCETILDSFGEKMDLLLPESSDGSKVTSWMGSLGFLNMLQRVANVIEFSSPLYNFNGPSYIPVSKIDSLEGVENVVFELFSKVQPILINKLSYKEEESYRAATLIAELCQNICQHSALEGGKPHGYMVMQAYKNSLKLAVMDLGRGIPETVKGKCKSYKEKDDGDIICCACKKGIPYEDHFSLGLYRALEIIKGGEGILNIRSGNAKMLFDYRKRNSVGEKKIPTPFFLGTQIGIYLPRKEQKRGGLEDEFEEGIF